jgi:hypothetical protein
MEGNVLVALERVEQSPNSAVEHSDGLMVESEE